MPDRYGHGQDDHPPDLEPRWSPRYDGREFVPDSGAPFAELAADYEVLNTIAVVARGGLAGVLPASWTGDAAVACASYIDQITSYLQAVVDATAEAARAARTADRAVEAAGGDAGRAARAANEAQAGHRSVEGDFFLHALFEDDHSHGLATAVKAGNEARGAALDACRRLVRQLDHPDHLLATATEPRISNPVAARLARDGNTSRARDAAVAFTEKVKNHPKAAIKLLARYAEALSPAEFRYLVDHLDDDALAAGLGALSPDRDRSTYNRIARHAPGRPRRARRHRSQPLLAPHDRRRPAHLAGRRHFARSPADQQPRLPATGRTR